MRASLSLVAQTLFAATLFAAQAVAQQSPSSTGVAPPTPSPGAPVTSGPAVTNQNVTGGSTGSSRTVLHSRHRNVSFQSRFTAAADQDGHLTLDAAKAHGFPQTAKYFSQIDKDNKGYVTYDEVTSFFRQRQAPTPSSKGH